MATKDQKEILERIESLEDKIKELKDKIDSIFDKLIPLSGLKPTEPGDLPADYPTWPPVIEPRNPWQMPQFPDPRQPPIRWETGTATQTTTNVDRFSVEIDLAKRIQDRLEQEED